jgi:cell wall-associated NlpC family hydrolase
VASPNNRVVTLASGRFCRARRLLLACVLAAPISLALPAADGTAAPAATVAQVQSEVRTLDQEVSLATEAYDRDRIVLTVAARSAVAAEGRLVVTRRTVAVLDDQLTGMAVAAYEDGDLGAFTPLLDDDASQQLLDSVGDLDQLALDRSEQLAGLQAAELAQGQALDLSRRLQQAAVSAAGALAAAQTRVEALLTREQDLLGHLRAAERVQVLAAVDAPPPSAASPGAASSGAASPGAASPSASSLSPGVPTATSGIVRIALQTAYAQIGKPYAWGGSGPDAFDCSGLTMFAFGAAGVSLPHSAAAQYGYGTHVAIADLQPGDLVFFAYGGYIGHVGIYVGDGDMIDAPHTGATVGVHPLYSGLIGGTRL